MKPRNLNGPASDMPRRWTWTGPDGKRRGVVLLPGTTRSDVLTWVERHLAAAFNTGKTARSRENVQRLQQAKVDHPSRGAADAAFLHGASVGDVVKGLGVQESTARRWQRELRDRGALRVKRPAKRLR